jgi:hypothetical protein
VFNLFSLAKTTVLGGGFPSEYQSVVIREIRGRFLRTIETTTFNLLTSLFIRQPPTTNH